MSWLTGWSYRKSHEINAAAGAGTNYQMKVVVHYGAGTDSGEDVYLNSKCRSDFGDIRFTDDDGSTELDYWMEDYVDGDYAVFWVEVADDLSSSAQTIYIYYGNASETTTSDADETFIFADIFSGTVLDTSKWQELGVGTITVGSGVVNIKTTGAWGHKRIAELANRDMAGIKIIKRWKLLTDIAQGNEAIYAESDLSSLLWMIFRAFNVDKLSLYTTQSGGWGNRWISTEVYALNTWFKMHILILAATIQIMSYNDDYTVRDQSTAIAYDTGTKMPCFGQGNANDEGQWDYICYAKYVSPEPAHGDWGSEETEVGLPAVFGMGKTYLVMTL